MASLKDHLAKAPNNHSKSTNEIAFSTLNPRTNTPQTRPKTLNHNHIQTPPSIYQTVDSPNTLPQIPHICHPISQYEHKTTPYRYP
ncbi:hypothetical protein [Rubritalea tangerina]|uniref:hypothetical protein n=1 Tax=Rubritalea tangerina TaxID=430798 RepID=UPI0036227A9D